MPKIIKASEARKFIYDLMKEDKDSDKLISTLSLEQVIAYIELAEQMKAKLEYIQKEGGERLLPIKLSNEIRKVVLEGYEFCANYYWIDQAQNLVSASITVSPPLPQELDRLTDIMFMLNQQKAFWTTFESI